MKEPAPELAQDRLTITWDPESAHLAAAFGRPSQLQHGPLELIFVRMDDSTCR